MGRLIDPDEQTVFVYRPKQETEVYDRPEIILPVPTFAANLQLSLDTLFGWLLEWRPVGWVKSSTTDSP